MRKPPVVWRAKARRARSIWGHLPVTALAALKELTSRFALSVAAGDLQFLENRWYVTHAGLLRIAQRRGCLGISTILQERQSDPVAGRWVFKAAVYKSRGSRVFTSYGDADPTNVLQWSVARRCGLRRPGPSIARCARLMESDSVQLRSLARPQHRRASPPLTPSLMGLILPTAQPRGDPGCGINFAW